MPILLLSWYKQLFNYITYSLPSGLSVGRSNIKQVAERRRVDIERFLNTLFRMADEIAHSDIVYTFFHPLLRDQQEANINAAKVKGNFVSVEV
jgi:phosphatidylinositol-4-phosphate 3-kinase